MTNFIFGYASQVDELSRRMIEGRIITDIAIFPELLHAFLIGRPSGYFGKLHEIFSDYQHRVFIFLRESAVTECSI